MNIAINDTIEMKKPHPCSKTAKTFTVLRVGADIKIKCVNCGREVMVPRVKIEKGIVKIQSAAKTPD